MKTGFLDKLIERLDRLDPESLQTQFLRLSQEKGLLETIFQAIQEGVILLDGEGRIRYVNRAAEHLMGIRPETAYGKPVSRYLAGLDWERVLALDASEWSKLVRREVEVRYPEHRFLSFYVVPLSAVRSEQTGAAVMLRDVTAERRRETSLLESERLNALKLLAAGVAHEVGNPLNALNIHLQLMGRELARLPEEQTAHLRQLLGVARNEVVRLDQIIAQFLKAIRPTKPKFALSQVDSLLRDTLTVLKQEIRNRNIRVEVDRRADLPKVRVDRGQMKQAFFNLVKNALEAMPDGGELKIRMSLNDRFVAVAFQDTGKGFAPEDFSHLFEPYYTTKPEGSGLGLMVVQRIVQEHGGAIEVHSEKGVGTTFTVFLPLAERRIHLLEAHPPAPARPDEEKR